MQQTPRVGVVSDTHGLVRPEAVRALEGVDHILHAGDVGRPEVLEALGRLAPVTAVRGNVDRGPWASALPETAELELQGLRCLVLHDRAALTVDPVEEGFDVVVSGHSHKPLVEHRRGVLYLNPGSIGPRRFHLPVSLAYLWSGPEGVRAELMELDVPPPRRH